MSDMSHFPKQTAFTDGASAVVPPPYLLTAFVTVAQHSNLVGAAKAMGMPYIVVARQIAQLEATLSAPVFYRSDDALSLTPFGAVLYDQVSPEMQKLQQQAATCVSKYQHLLVPTAPSAPELTIELSVWGIASALKPHLDILQDLNANLKFCDYNQVTEPDIICYLDQAPRAGYETTLLFGEEIITVVSPDYPMPQNGFDEMGLMEEPLLQLGHPDHIDDWQSYLGLNPDEPLIGVPKAPYESFGLYLQAIRSGRGVGVGLAPLFASEIEKGTLRCASPRRLWRNRACYVGVRNDCEHKPVAREFAKIMSDIFE